MNDEFVASTLSRVMNVSVTYSVSELEQMFENATKNKVLNYTTSNLSKVLSKRPHIFNMLMEHNPNRIQLIDEATRQQFTKVKVHARNLPTTFDIQKEFAKIGPLVCVTEVTSRDCT
jgi:hypothetical protein